MRSFSTLLLLSFIVLSFAFAGRGARLKAFANSFPKSPLPAATSSVTVFGDFQSELGCASDFQADCALTKLTYDANDDVWQGTFSIPAGSWHYKAALNDDAAQNYGANAQPNGLSISLTLAAATVVKFYYDDKTHWITTKYNSVIATAPGSFQSEIGCPGDWQPDCIRSWLEDADGDGVYTFETTALPAGNYETKAAIDESWNENYGAGGAAGGANIQFTVSADNQKTLFSYDSRTHILTVNPSVVTAASVSIGGRVVTVSGRGVSGARLSLTDSAGNVATAATTSLGYFRFTNVRIGETYVLSASGKRYAFSQPVQILNVNDETDDIIFIADSDRRSKNN